MRLHAIGYFTSALPGFKLIGTRGDQLCVDGTDPFSSPRIYLWPTAPWCALTHNTGYGYATRAGYYLLNGTNGGTYSQKGHPPVAISETGDDIVCRSPAFASARAPVSRLRSRRLTRRASGRDHSRRRNT